MIAYLDLVDNIKSTLLADEDINSVLIGNIDEIDTNKQTMFPLAHLLVGASNFINGMVRFSVTISTMDIVDIKKDNPDKGEEEWQTNKQFVKNTMLSVLENLHKNLTSGTMQELGWEVVGGPQTPTADPFEDRFENLLTGWSMTLVIDVPNTVQNCA